MSLDNATVHLPLIDFKDMERKILEQGQQLEELRKLDRAERMNAAPNLLPFIQGLIGARRCIGFAISHLGAETTAGWPVNELRDFLEALKLVDNGDPDVQQTVLDFGAFAREVDEAEAIRAARKSTSRTPVDVGDARATSLLDEHERQLNLSVTTTSTVEPPSKLITAACRLVAAIDNVGDLSMPSPTECAAIVSTRNELAKELPPIVAAERLPSSRATYVEELPHA